VTLPEISKTPAMSQLLMVIVSGAPTSSVSVTVTGDADRLLQKTQHCYRHATVSIGSGSGRRYGG
jgi:hypothetical protein